MAATVRLLDTLTQFDGMPGMIGSCGAIDAIATDLRTYKDNQEIIASSINVLTAVGLLTVADAQNLTICAEGACAMSFEALNGVPAAFSAALS